MKNTKIKSPVITRQIFDTALKSYTFEKSPTGNCLFIVHQLTNDGEDMIEVDRFRTNGFTRLAQWSWLNR